MSKHSFQFTLSYRYVIILDVNFVPEPPPPTEHREFILTQIPYDPVALSTLNPNWTAHVYLDRNYNILTFSHTWVSTFTLPNWTSAIQHSIGLENKHSPESISHYDQLNIDQSVSIY